MIGATVARVVIVSNILPITITIPGAPRGKQRPRAGANRRIYTPQETVNAEAWVKACAVEQVGIPRFECALEIDVTLARDVPESWSRKKRAAALAGTFPAVGRPDIDNAVKLLVDALNGIVWVDDAQIVAMTVRKRFSESPGTTMVVSEAAP